MRRQMLTLMELTVMLLIFDETNEVCNVLHLNRDTMLKMPVLGIGGAVLLVGGMVILLVIKRKK